jgi:hypothetical protein
MLAMADRRGHVEASIPGLADASRVTLPECEEALAHLSAPDAYSRSTAHDGRRIAAIDGGWTILNYSEYRERVGVDQKRENTAERTRRWRERKKQMRDAVCDVVYPNVTYIAEAEADAERQEECMFENALISPDPDLTPSIATTSVIIETNKKRKDKKRPASGDYTPEFETFWRLYPRRRAKGAAAKAWAAARKNGHWPGDVAVLAAVERQTETEEWQKNNGQFIPHPSTWLNQGRWDDEVRERGQGYLDLIAEYEAEEEERRATDDD